MAVIKNLDQQYVDTQLVCPPGKSQDEVVDPERTGLYIEVRASAPNQGTFYLRCKDTNGKTVRRRIGRTTEVKLEDARASAVRFKAELRSDAGSPPSTPAERPLPVVASKVGAGTELTLDEFWTKHYFPHAKAHKRSYGRDEQLYRLRIKPKFGHLPLKGITRLAVQQFQTALLAEGLSKASANHHVQLMRRFCNLAVSWEMLDRNVLRGIELFHLDNLVEHYLDDKQVDHLVKTLGTHKNRMVSLVILFLLSTGARLREGLCAQWKEVDVSNAVWRIPATNSKSKRLKSLPLNTSALWVIEQLDSEGKSSYLFPSPATGKPYTTITRAWYVIRRAAGIPDNVRIHDLRHTFASRLVSAGRSMVELQNLLGHADPRVSQRYAHLSSKSALAASNAAAFSVG
jgi:site-specific recombinase XerD